MALQPDSLAVVDNLQLRITLVPFRDPVGNERVLRAPFRPLLPPFSNWVRHGVHWVESGLGSGSGEVGSLLHALGPPGEGVVSFGRSDGVFRWDRPWLMARALASGPSGIRALEFNRYVRQRFDSRWALQTTITVEAGWFRPWQEYPEGAPFHAPPPPEMVGLWEDEVGLLWVMGLVAAEGWAAGPVDRRETVIMDPADLHHLYDTVLDVVDPQRAELVARHRFTGRVMPTSTPGWVYRAEYDASGDLVLRVWSVRLRGR